VGRERLRSPPQAGTVCIAVMILPFSDDSDAD
jgi:hypothetical protein